MSECGAAIITKRPSVDCPKVPLVDSAKKLWNYLFYLHSLGKNRINRPPFINSPPWGKQN